MIAAVRETRWASGPERPVTGRPLRRQKAILVRRTVPLIVAAVSIALLTGCSGAPSGDDAGCTEVQPGSASKAVTVKGKKGEEPTVTFSKPLTSEKTERSYVITGKGERVTDSRTAEVAIMAFNGRTGDKISSNGYTKDSVTLPLTAGDTTVIPALTQLIECVPAGSRVVLTAPVEDAFGPADPSTLGFKEGDTIVFVSDIVSIVPDKADGEPQPETPGFPTVKLAKDGTPTVTIPKSDPPAATQLAVLKQGDGDEVQAGDSVTVQYQGVNWRTGEVFDQSWGRGVANFSTNAVVKGFADAMVGQRVGSQVITVIAPADGYGPQGGQPAAGIEADDTLVFVIDILATAH